MSARPRVLAWPIGGRDIASSRLRLYAPLAELADRLDVRIVEPGCPDRSRPSALLDGADLLYLQKDARPGALTLAEEAVCRGVPVVYDLDDDPGCWPGMDELALVGLASAVTVDCLGRAAEVARWSNAVYPIPCMIDLAGDPARLEYCPARAPTSVVTFGNGPSLEGTRRFLAAVPRAMQVRVIGPARARGRFSRVDYRAFALESFVADLLTSDVALLAHDATQASRKDENRLVMALSCRLPAFVAPSPAYHALLSEFGGLDLIVETPDDLKRALDALDPGRLAELANAGYAHVWQAYSPSTISNRLFEVLVRPLDSR